MPLYICKNSVTNSLLLYDLKKQNFSNTLVLVYGLYWLYTTYYRLPSYIALRYHTFTWTYIYFIIEVLWHSKYSVSIFIRSDSLSDGYQWSVIRGPGDGIWPIRQHVFFYLSQCSTVVSWYLRTNVSEILVEITILCVQNSVCSMAAYCTVFKMLTHVRRLSREVSTWQCRVNIHQQIQSINIWRYWVGIIRTHNFNVLVFGIQTVQLLATWHEQFLNHAIVAEISAA